MSGPFNNNFAVKLGDKSECHIKDHSKCWGYSHGPMITASDSVLVEGKGMARAGDQSRCEKGQTDYVVTGVAGIYVNARLAARTDSRTLHAQGYVEGTASSVLLNGPGEGASFGPDAASLPDCQGAKQTRVRPGDRQSFNNNCGTEQMRMILNRGKRPGDPGYLSEQQTIDIVNDRRRRRGEPPWDPQRTGLSTEEINDTLDEQMRARGQGGSQQVGTSPEKKFHSPAQKEYIKEHGGMSSPGDLQEQLINGKPAIVPVNGEGFIEGRAGQYQGELGDGGHVVGVVGVTYNADGTAKSYVVNDTSAGGDCALNLDAKIIDKNLAGEKGPQAGRVVVPT